MFKFIDVAKLKLVKIGAAALPLLVSLLGALTKVVGLLGSFLRKNAAKADSENINKAVEAAKAAADMRAKIAAHHAAKVDAQIELEKSRDSVDVGNDIIADLNSKK
jgi:hypothetical protein